MQDEDKQGDLQTVRHGPRSPGRHERAHTPLHTGCMVHSEFTARNTRSGCDLSLSSLPSFLGRVEVAIHRMRLLAYSVAVALTRSPAPARRLGVAPFASIASWQSAAEKDGVQFVGSYVSPDDMPSFPGMAEITLAGRSNVGKSSALNALSCRRKKIAVTSKTPGRTRMINLFRVGKACTITDLPGYGFAKVSRQMQDDWRKQIERYLRRREALKLAVLFVDAQREPQDSDAQLLDFLEANELQTLVVATKADKLSKTALAASLERLQQSLALPEGQPLALASPKGVGMKELWRKITDMCAQAD
jgi:GTP-binding protein